MSQSDRTSKTNLSMSDLASKEPWYANQPEYIATPKPQEHKNPSNYLFQKGADRTTHIYKYRKGACENCGASTHKTKECVERPRKIGAKWSNKDFGHDEFILPSSKDFESKRDRWSTYDPESFKKIMIDYERTRQAKQEYQQEKAKEINDENLKSILLKDDELKRIDNEEDDEFLEIQKRKQDNDNRATAEIYQSATSKGNFLKKDYSRYLKDLYEDPNLDGKSRAMQESLDPTITAAITGNTIRLIEGDTKKLLETEAILKEANERNKGLNLNTIAMPTQAELYQRHHKQKKTNFRDEKFKRLEERYGEQGALNLPRNIIEGESEEYVEYFDSGKVKNVSKPTAFAKSKYPEDVFRLGHTSVWGSFYHSDFGWGFKCCLSFEKDKKCTGESGREINKNKIEKHDLDQKIKREEEIKRLNSDKDKREQVSRDKGNFFQEMMERMDNFESNKMLNRKRESEHQSISLEKQ